MSKFSHSYDFRKECTKCNQIFFSANFEIICESCRKKRNFLRTLGWGAVGGVSLVLPQWGSFLAGLMGSLESNLIGNPYEKKVYELHNQIKTLNQNFGKRDFSSSSPNTVLKYLKDSNHQFLRHIQSNNLMSDLFIAGNSPWIKIAINPGHFGVIGLERVNISTRFEYGDYPLFIDFFISDVEGKGLLHGGIPIDVINPMLLKSEPRKPLPYSCKNSDLSQPIDQVN